MFSFEELSILKSFLRLFAVTYVFWEIIKLSWNNVRKSLYVYSSKSNNNNNNKEDEELWEKK